jgi:flagellar M-ring protein FliF
VNSLIGTLQRLGFGPILAIGAVGIGLLAFFAFFANKLTQPPMGLLYSELTANDAGQIVAKLEGQNVPFELRAGGTQLWVPQDRALRLRMAMAEQGLPRGGSVGYEVFDQPNALGATSFVQNLNLVRALEGELARTIGALGPVVGARVHLSIPRRDLFSRERLEPSASVVLKLREAGRLPRSQVNAIQHLIASAVPNLKPGRVSIVDDRGALLARGNGEADDIAGGSSAATADERRLELEQRLARKIEEQIERALGPGKVRAEVSLEMDFDRVVTNAETFDPEGQVIRSQQTVSENTDASESSGSQGVTVANNLPDAENAPGGSQNRNKTTRQEETINYEVTKKVTNHVREVGTIKRLTASVMVDGVTTIGADGQPNYQPRNPEQLEQLRAAARAAVGFNERRGDAIELINIQFAGADLPNQPVDAPGMFSFSPTDIVSLTHIAVLGIISLLGILLVARPLLGFVSRATAAAAASAPGATPALADGSNGGPAALAPPAPGQPPEPGAVRPVRTAEFR